MHACTYAQILQSFYSSNDDFHFILPPCLNNPPPTELESSEGSVLHYIKCIMRRRVMDAKGHRGKNGSGG